MKATACPTGSEGGDEDVEVWRDGDVLVKVLKMNFHHVVIDDEHLNPELYVYMGLFTTLYNNVKCVLFIKTLIWIQTAF